MFAILTHFFIEGNQNNVNEAVFDLFAPQTLHFFRSTHSSTRTSASPISPSVLSRLPKTIPLTCRDSPPLNGDYPSIYPHFFSTDDALYVLYPSSVSPRTFPAHATPAATAVQFWQRSAAIVEGLRSRRERLLIVFFDPLFVRRRPSRTPRPPRDALHFGWDSTTPVLIFGRWAIVLGSGKDWFFSWKVLA